MADIDQTLQAIAEGEKLIVPFGVALQILGTMQRIELKKLYGGNNNGKLPNSLQHHDEK